ncbi:solute carrier family 3 (amino acid transporter heavy chain), member 1 L homeolog [Xenopus laevis]|uniref:Amino acid transporter heavy chain SLC3A1 n=1 Tax=Xenopus laevis TaxID=8355 RepID=Q32NL8_XENLA|nr:solute carrier family 3 (amino acid transporter heavy chain), member 1 L homeolog [Xenopus laevis]AAI08569.1 MGC131051 protein [Xenopus laevis]
MEEEPNSVELKQKAGHENNGFISDHDGRDEDKPEKGKSRRNSKEGDAHIYSVRINEVPEDSPPLKPYAGMPKDVLLQFSNRPCYRIAREIIFWLIIVATLAIIAATIAIIAISPKCLDWWQRSPMYQVYPKSFKDSNNDGSGDLKGVQEKIDHFLYLNIKNVWVAPFYKSSLKDFNYAVDDFMEVDPTFGTMADFESMISAMHDKGLKLIIDLIPNHTSNKHKWFQLSRNRTGKYADYYIWHDCMQTGGLVVPPNNWVSFYGNSAWEYDDTRKQCYLHQFKKEQPDLDFNNPDVNEEILNIIKFWLEKGVDGFTINSAKFLLEAEHLRDEPQVNKLQNPDTISNYSELFHDYTTTQVGMHDIIRNFRQTINKYSREPGRYRFMGTESNDQAAVDKTMLYYGNSFIQEADFPLNAYLFDLNKANIDGASIFSMVDLWMKAMPSGKWPNWMVGGPSSSRIASRVGRQYVNVMNMLLLTLPGTPTTYYGEELGMEDGSPQVSTENPQEYNPTEYPEKTPMQWDSSSNAGFSEANRTWLSVNPDYEAVNVEAQKNEQYSTLNLYRELNHLRNNELPLHRGWLCYTWSDNNVFAYVRELDGLNKVFMMVLNFGQAWTINLRQAVPDLPGEAKIRLSTEGSRVGKAVSTDSIQTQPGEGLILEYKTNKPVHVRDTFKDKCFISEKACYTSAFDLLYNSC